jgi:hypothetical protein
VLGLFRRRDVAIGNDRNLDQGLDHGDGVVFGFAGILLQRVRP